MPDAAIVGRKTRARGGCEAAARKGRRETSAEEKAEKALLIVLSSFRNIYIVVEPHGDTQRSRVSYFFLGKRVLSLSPEKLIKYSGLQ
jgi:hypothetical protein